MKATGRFLFRVLTWMSLAWIGVLPATAGHDVQAARSGTLASPVTRVEQHVLLDETQSLTLQDVLARNFQPFNPLQRLPMEFKTTWLRLTVSRENLESDTNEPMYLRLLPPVFDSLVLHTRDTQSGDRWHTTDLSDRFRSKAISLGQLPAANPVYLQIRATYASGLVAYAGSQEEVAAFNQRLAVTVAMISTVLTFAWLIMLWKVLTQFTQLSLAISVFLPTVLFRLWVVVGYGPELLNLSAEWGQRIHVPLVCANVLCGGWVFILLAMEVFRGTRWFSWLWSWVVLAFCNLILSFFQPEWAVRVIDGMMLWGALLFMLSIALAALKTRKTLTPWPARIAVFILVLIAAFSLIAALQLQGVVPNASALQDGDVLTKSLLVRSLVPIALIGIVSWTYESLRRERMTRMQTDLINATTSLDLESKRLERQRNFTAMLAHELKNPLTASEMALSGIQQRLARDDPAQQRAEKIKTSLQEINAIVDRCTEVDGYEQGQMPMSIHTFSVTRLLDLVQSAHPSDRIYTLVRDLPEAATLTSDLQYIKLILNNLLANALKYSPPDSLIELQLSLQPDEPTAQLVISVTNEIGPAGVPDKQRLFDRFYRSEGARNQSGAGLGLWLSQALAQALGTRIISHAEDNWISFTLALNLDHATH